MKPDRSTRAVSRAAAIVCAALLAVLFTQGSVLRKRSMILSDLAIAGGYRPVEPRVSVRHPYARFRMVPAEQRFRNLLDENATLMVEAGALPAGRETGLVNLLFSEWTKAIAVLDRKSNAVDVSAAYYMRGVETGSIHDFARALQALSNAGDSPHVTFNRALILEQLFDSPAAVAEWLHYLEFDPDSEWADEARRHLAANTREPVPLAWKREKPLLVEAAASGNVQRVRELTKRYPLGARRLVELELLPAWGNATLCGDAVAADRALRASREIVRARHVPDERRLLAALDEIDATGSALAEAYAIFGDGYVALDERRLDDARFAFSEAQRLGAHAYAFDSLVTAHEIEALYLQYAYSRAQDLIDATRARYGQDQKRFLTLFARLDWLTGLLKIKRGEASEAIRLYQRALAVYERLGEAEYIAAQHVNQADSFTYLGETERAGVHVRKALLYATNSENPKRLHGILKVAASLTLETAGPAAPIAFENRVVRRARAGGRTWWLTDALVSRAPLLVQAGRQTDALRDLAEVRRLAPDIENEKTRSRVMADACTAMALVYRDRDDRKVIDNLSRAIVLYDEVELRPFLTQLLLQRGRTHLRLGDTAAAERDFHAAVEELERQRTLVDESELRIAYFDRADLAFVELAALLLRKGRAEDAFDLLERSRSRELLDRASGRPTQPLPVSAIRAALPPDTTLVTHTVSAASLITCIVSANGVRVFEQPAGEAVIAPLVDALNNGFESPEGLPMRDLRRLSELLLAGIPRKPGARIVFVPDRILHRAPFAALQSADGRYVIEDETIAVAASATMVVRVANGVRRVTRRAAQSVFVVASPERPEGFHDLPALPRAVEEAKEVAASYALSKVVMGSVQDSKSLLAMAGGYDVFHFGGHSVVDQRMPARSSLLVGASGRITAGEIEAAQLQRVQLVVLGGCNTALGKSHRSEGVMSIARAFMVASVPAVVGTVAPIDDEAAERVLTELHRAYARGLDPAAALREAQLRMLRSKDPQNADPARWSSFQVIGGAG